MHCILYDYSITLYIYIHLKNVAGSNISGFYRLNPFLPFLVALLAQKRQNRVKQSQNGQIAGTKRAKKKNENINGSTIITYVAVKSICMNDRYGQWLCLHQLLRKWLHREKKCFQNEKIWHKINILPTISYSNSMIHFIIFVSIFELCNTFRSLAQYIYIDGQEEKQLCMI